MGGAMGDAIKFSMKHPFQVQVLRVKWNLEDARQNKKQAARAIAILQKSKIGSRKVIGRLIDDQMTKLDQAQHDVDRWTMAWKNLNPCEACKGLGEKSGKPCRLCHGSGTSPKV